MEVKVIRMRRNGVAISGRALNQEFPAAGTLVILDVTDQGLRRQVKVARLLQGQAARYELVDPHIVWAADGRFTLAGFERQKLPGAVPGAGQGAAPGAVQGAVPAAGGQDGGTVDYAQSWLCILEGAAPHAGPGRPPRTER